MKMNLLNILSFLSFILLSCTTPPTPPLCNCSGSLELFDGLKSYTSIKEFEATIKEKSDTLIIVENSGLDSNDKRPPFDIYTVKIPTYTSGNKTGRLQATFFNNRLVSLSFAPLNKDQFEKEFQESTNCCIQTTINLPKTEYRWADRELDGEMRAWINKYA
jgi:hypothetical protein